MSKKTYIRVGPGFFGSLTLVLLVAKLLGYTQLGWFWVFLPVTLPLFILIVIFAILGFTFLATKIWKS
jgi:hypothetical protein